jgi:manganese oxidase
MDEPTTPTPRPRLDRRKFLGVGGGAALLCTLGGRQYQVRDASDVREVDAAAASLPRPKAAKGRRDPVDDLRFGTPQPQPGGRVKEYWIQARPVRWNVAPTGRDEWMGHRVPRKRTFTAFVYQQCTAGFASAMGKPRMPGPTLHAEVGDVVKVHFRNAGRPTFNQAVTMHPHGLRYTPDYDGAYLGDFTRVGGFVRPGEEFTYTWEAVPDSVGVWPYHDHGPNHTLNTFRGLFGAIVVTPRGTPPPDVETVIYMHSFPPQITGFDSVVMALNGRTFAGNTPTIRAKVGQRVAWHVIGGDSNFHTFHIHGHRWKDAAGADVDNPIFGPNETVSAVFTEDNPGRWLYHCHVFTHQDAGMAGWYLVEP